MNSLFSIKEKVVVITGGAGVLGGSLALYLVENGAKVVILGRNKESLNKMLDEIKKVGSDVVGYSCDVLVQSEIEDVKAKIIELWGKVDVLINCAGGNLPGATIGENQNVFDLDMSDFRKVSELNLDGTVIPTLVFAKEMSNQGFGSVINMSSMAAISAITRVVGYSTSKAAIDIFTKWMATELSLKFSDKIRVNAVAPGFFIGNQNRALLTNSDGSFTNRGETIIKNTPMKRFGNADELNGAVHWLISDAATFVTGAIIPVDGGFSAFSGV